MNAFSCSMMGHDWMRNGVPPQRDRGFWLGTAPDWQRCLRCGLWELVVEMAEGPLARNWRIRSADGLEASPAPVAAEPRGSRDG
jgi:hypothetical protein